MTVMPSHIRNHCRQFNRLDKSKLKKLKLSISTQLIDFQSERSISLRIMKKLDGFKKRKAMIVS
jgi:hypothetical protein